MTTEIFDPATTAVDVRPYTPSRQVAWCQVGTCRDLGTFSVTRQDIYDGYWLDACPVHLVAAVHLVGAHPKGAEPHGPHQVRSLAVHTTTCPYSYLSASEMAPFYCCRSTETFHDAPPTCLCCGSYATRELPAPVAAVCDTCSPRLADGGLDPCQWHLAHDYVTGEYRPEYLADLASAGRVALDRVADALDGAVITFGPCQADRVLGAAPCGEPANERGGLCPAHEAEMDARIRPLWSTSNPLTLVDFHPEHDPSQVKRGVLCADHLRTARSCDMIDHVWFSAEFSERCVICDSGLTGSAAETPRAVGCALCGHLHFVLAYPRSGWYITCPLASEGCDCEGQA